MTQLTIFADDAPQAPLLKSENFHDIQTALNGAGIALRRWQAQAPLTEQASHTEILAAYQAEIAQLVAEGGYQTWDVVSMHPAHPEKSAFRDKFLAEHTHAEDEVRFFVAGSGLFSLHIDKRVYEVLCTQGDLINVPAGTKHWFDMGPNPSFTAIRLFNNPAGWVAQFTDSPIAKRYSRLAN